MDYEIKGLTTGDADAMFELVNEIKDEGKFLFATQRFRREGTPGYLESHIAAGNPVIGAFSEGDGLVGWADFNPGGFEEIAHVASLGMGVRKAHRGRGLGRRLLAACVEQARRLGLEKLELEVFDSNAGARALYGAMGFVEEGRLRRKRKYQGRYEDLVCMALFLLAPPDMD